MGKTALLLSSSNNDEHYIKCVWSSICVSRFVAKYFGTLHECKKGSMRSYQDFSCQLKTTSLFLSTFILQKYVYHSRWYIHAKLILGRLSEAVKSNWKYFTSAQFVNSIFIFWNVRDIPTPILARKFVVENSQI